MLQRQHVFTVAETLSHDHEILKAQWGVSGHVTRLVAYPGKMMPGGATELDANGPLYAVLELATRVLHSGPHKYSGSYGPTSSGKLIRTLTHTHTHTLLRKAGF